MGSILIYRSKKIVMMAIGQKWRCSIAGPTHGKYSIGHTGNSSWIVILDLVVAADGHT